MKRLYFLLLSLIPLVAQAQILNPDFENWEVKRYENLKYPWFTSNSWLMEDSDTTNVKKVPGVDGIGYAVRLETFANSKDTTMGFISNAIGDPLLGRGGRVNPFQPINFSGHYRYYLPGNDTAMIILIFKKAGIIISQDIFKIKGTGNEPVFTSFSFPLNMAQTPDSVIIAASSGNYLTQEGMDGNSWIEFDNLTIDGRNNFLFEDWDTASLDKADNWNSYGDVTRTDDKYSGNWAAKLVSSYDMEGELSEALMVGDVALSGETVDTLTGYFKYTSSGADKCSFFCLPMKNGAPIGTASLHYYMPNSAYAPFKIVFDYENEAPDMVRLYIASGGTDNTPTILNSTLFIDALKLNKEAVNIKRVEMKKGECIVYPSPAHDVLNIAFPTGNNDKTTVTLYDVMGKSVFHNQYTTGKSIITIPVANLANGIYYYEVITGNTITKNKFVKE